jgi:hypothetical protein
MDEMCGVLAGTGLPNKNFPNCQEAKRFEKEMRQPRIERGAHRMLLMATMDFTTKPLTLWDLTNQIWTLHKIGVHVQFKAIEAPHHSKLRSGILLPPREQFPHAGFAAKAERPDDMDEARKTLRLGNDNVTVKLAISSGPPDSTPRTQNFKTPLLTNLDPDAIRNMGHHNPPLRLDRVTKSGLQLATCADSNFGPGRHGRDNSALSFLPVVSDSAASPIR